MGVGTKRIACVVLVLGTLHSVAAFAQQTDGTSVDGSTTGTTDTTVDSSTDVSLNQASTVTSGVSIAGAINVSGSIEVSESAMASVSNDQLVNDNIVNIADSLGNSVTIGGNVLAGSTGNIGLNVASGDINVQDNASAIAAGGPAAAGMASDGSSLVIQASSNNAVTGGTDIIQNQAFLRENVLEAAQGNIGVNIASGTLNVQKNALTVSAVAGDSVLSSATAAVAQRGGSNQVDHANGTTNFVSLGGSALINASGNIGVNVAAGSNNLQANSLNISASN